MEMRRLGKNGPEVSVIGFGAWAMGGRGWGEVDDRETVAAVQRSIDLGSTFVDTAEVYGNGHSEELVGQAIAGRRQEVFLATKVGGSDLSRKHIMEAIDQSLRRLQTEYVDLYQLHWPDEHHPVEESMRALDDLVRAGKVRYVGVSNFDVPLLRRCLSVRHVDSLQPVYSLLNRGIEEEILPFCQQHGIGVVVYSPMAKGLLTGKYTPDATFARDDVRAEDPLFQGERFRRNLAFVDRLRDLARAHGVTVAQLALNWTLQHPGVTVAIAGAKRPAQVEENVGGQGWQLTPEELRQIEAWLQELT
ncbi:MAG TPA: aldo/keto reductase [Chloroflexota bacterium]|jgi:aryl-alcohol dehydrogenase-like predicted oxidoreductase|nr:aldo/keto reductase [Chloroflexota bacterium]